MSEFDLIATYFTWDNSSSNVITGVGDDAAVLEISDKKQLLTSVDTLVSGVHFPANTPAKAIAHKALAVNLSDLAAMGAKPEWFTLALTLAEINHDWLQAFSAGLKALAQHAGVSLVGGDITSGPLAISIQIMGLVDNNKALLRSGAKQGDKIYVTGTLGDAAAGLQSIYGKLELAKSDALFCEQRLNLPQARVAESSVISQFATSCIDVSDGLLQDLSHILKQSSTVSEKGAVLDLSAIPLSAAMKKLAPKQAQGFALTGGDDYELLFTIATAQEVEFLQKIQQYQVTCIGVINDHSANILDTDGNQLSSKGFNHFNDNY